MEADDCADTKRNVYDRLGCGPRTVIGFNLYISAYYIFRQAAYAGRLSSVMCIGHGASASELLLL